MSTFEWFLFFWFGMALIKWVILLWFLFVTIIKYEDTNQGFWSVSINMLFGGTLSGIAIVILWPIALYYEGFYYFSLPDEQAQEMLLRFLARNKE